MMRYGFSRDDIKALEDRLRAKGVSDDQITRNLQRHNDFLDYYRREFCGNNYEEARIGVEAADGVIEEAIGTDHWIRTTKEWKNRHPFESPSPELRTRWAREGDELARKKWNEYMNRP